MELQSGHFNLEPFSNKARVYFKKSYPLGVVPAVVVTPPYQTSFWITDLDNAGFTFNVGTKCGYNTPFSFIAHVDA